MPTVLSNLSNIPIVVGTGHAHNTTKVKNNEKTKTFLRILTELNRTPTVDLTHCFTNCY